MRAIFLILTALLSVSCSRAQTPPLTPGKWTPSDGDRVVFLGDSITQQCLYTQYVENWIAITFPDRTVQFRNAGVGGDRTVNMPARFERDVAEFRPTHVLVLLGMNDGGYMPFNQTRYDEYRTGMEDLVDRIEAIGAEPVLLSPTYYDSRIAMSQEDVEASTIEHYPGVLQLYSGWLERMATRRGLRFIDLYSPMQEATRVGREKDPSFTLVSDAVHPDPIGHDIIAETIVENWIADPGPVSSLVITPSEINDHAGGTTEDFQWNDTVISFTHTSTSLPSYQREESLSLVGVPVDTSWELLIDDALIGKWSAIELAKGISLSGNLSTPQQLQKLRVIELNEKRNEKQSDLRNWWEQKKLKDWALYELEQQNSVSLPEERAIHEEWLSEFDKIEPILEEMSAGIWEDVMANAQPTPHRYVFRKVPENGL